MDSIKSLFIFAVLVFGIGMQAFEAHALVGDDCAPDQQIIGRWIFNRQFTVGDGCLVQVTAKDKTDLTYREYVFDQAGRMLVYNSTPGQNDRISTAQRNFFFLPTRSAPTMKREGDLMIIKMASGIEVEFNGFDLIPRSRTPGFEIIETGGVDLLPGGGVEVTQFPEFMLDTGWAIGQRAYLRSVGFSALQASGGPRCPILNMELFVLKDSVTGENFYQPLLRCNQAACLTDYLKEKCGL